MGRRRFLEAHQTETRKRAALATERRPKQTLDGLVMLVARDVMSVMVLGVMGMVPDPDHVRARGAIDRITKSGTQE